MSWKPKYFIVYPHKSVDNLRWECTTHYACMAHIPNMLRELLGVSTVGREIKLIWNFQHQSEMKDKYNISYQQLEDYIKSNCSMLSFTAKGTRKRAIKELKRLGAKELCLADSYRDMMLMQAFYRNHQSFPPDATVV